METIGDLATKLTLALANLDEEDRIDALNEVRARLHEVSPLRHNPVDLVLWVRAGGVHANDYNPNSVAPPEMRLLAHSISEDGYTQPIVTVDIEDDEPTVVDGFHRHRVGREVPEIRDSCRGRLPIVGLRAERRSRSDLMAATVRHNRARGKHSVDGLQALVAELASRGWSDRDIQSELGMDVDEVLRLRQLGGLAKMFAERAFSEAWEEIPGGQK